MEQNTQSKIQPDNPIWPWLIQYAGQVIYTHKTFKIDGRTARQRIRADPSIPLCPYFGESIMFKPAKTVIQPKQNPKWRDGIWLGFIDSTNERIIGTNVGVMKCRAIRRQESTEQFSMIETEKITGTP